MIVSEIVFMFNHVQSKNNKNNGMTFTRCHFTVTIWYRVLGMVYREFIPLTPFFLS